jgi:hypothetical protein
VEEEDRQLFKGKWNKDIGTGKTSHGALKMPAMVDEIERLTRWRWAIEISNPGFETKLSQSVPDVLLIQRLRDVGQSGWLLCDKGGKN